MMKRLFVVAVLSAGCGGSPSGPSTFAAINGQVFQTFCAFSDACHNAAGAHASANLNLKDDPYAALVNVPADTPKAKGEGKLRVQPMDSANSFLYIKLTLPAIGGACQPPAIDQQRIVDYGACMPYTSAPLDQSFLDGIKKWIDAGALKN
jgi:hypothetical protein